MKFDSFISSIDTEFVLIRIADNVLEEEDWGIDELIISNGVVIRQTPISKGAYTMPNMLGWSVNQLLHWSEYDATGCHPEQYHEISTGGHKDESTRIHS